MAISIMFSVVSLVPLLKQVSISGMNELNTVTYPLHALVFSLKMGGQIAPSS